jgi:hypothetical protein
MLSVMTSPAEEGRKRAAGVTGLPDAAAAEQLRQIFARGVEDGEPGPDDVVRAAARRIRARATQRPGDGRA